MLPDPKLHSDVRGVLQADQDFISSCLMVGVLYSTKDITACLMGSILWKQPWYDEAVLMDLCSILWKFSLLGLLDSKSLASGSTSVQLPHHVEDPLVSDGPAL